MGGEEVILKQEDITSFHTNSPFQCYLSIFGVCVCVCVCVCACFVYIHHLKRKDIVESKLLILVNYSCNLMEIAAMRT